MIAYRLLCFYSQWPFVRLSELMETKKATLNSTRSEPVTTGERKAKLFVALLCLGLSALAAVPFFFMGYSSDGNEVLKLQMPQTHDMILHYDQMRSFYDGLS